MAPNADIAEKDHLWMGTILTYQKTTMKNIPGPF